MKLIIYTDGASRGNPGPASYGFTVSDERGKLLLEVGEYMGIATNNAAEYTAVLKALERVEEKFGHDHSLQIQLFADSKLVAEQLSGRYKIKSPNLIPLIESIKRVIKNLDAISFAHIPRSKNTEADRLANKALDNL